MTTTCGRVGTYVAGCRCQKCRDALSRWRNMRELERMAGMPDRRLDATGTARRLRALAAMGWTTADIAAGTGCHPYLVQRWMSGRNTYIYRDSAAKVRAVYDRLSMTPGPSVEARKRAERKGWAPPLAWEGTPIDDPAAKPQGVGWKQARGPAAKGILVENAGDLLAAGMSLEEAAARLGVRPESIERARLRARKGAA